MKNKRTRILFRFFGVLFAELFPFFDLVFDYRRQVPYVRNSSYSFLPIGF